MIIKTHKLRIIIGSGVMASRVEGIASPVNFWLSKKLFCLKMQNLDQKTPFSGILGA